MSIVSIRDGLSNYISTIQSALDAAGLSRPSQSDSLIGNLQAAQAAVEQVKAAEEQTAILLSDQTRSAQYRVDTSDQIRTTAASQAQSALDALRASADAVYARVSSAWHPALPSGVSELAVFERKHDVQRLLESRGGTGDPGAILRAAAQLLSEALLKGTDDARLTAYIIASGPLDLFYQAHMIGSDTAAAQFASTVGRSKTPDGKVLAGSELEPLIGEGGALARFIAVAQNEIASSLAAMKAAADQWAQIFAGQGTYRPGANDGQPTSVDPSARYLRGR